MNADPKSDSVELTVVEAPPCNCELCVPFDPKPKFDDLVEQPA